MLVDAIQRIFAGPQSEPREIRLARDALAEAIAAQKDAQATADKAQADLERVEKVAASAAEQIESGLIAARSARTARQDARAVTLASGDSAPTDTDAELAVRERQQLAAVGDARIEKRAAEKALEALREKVGETAEALRRADELVTERANAVVRAQAAHLTADVDSLVGELTERYRTLAAAAAVAGGIDRPPVPQIRFAREHLADPAAAFGEFRKRLATDAEAKFDV
jgi:hypothetical protein